MKLPNEIKKPGAYDINIVAREVPISSSGGAISVGATAAVITQLRVMVPYPGKYLDANIRVSETDLGKPVTFIIPLNHLGTETIVRAEGIVDIIGPTNEKIDSIITEVVSIEPGESIQLKAVWDSSEVKAGKFLARLSVTYDGDVANAETVFSLGDILIDVLDIYVKDFKLGQIARFNILVENKYSEEIKDVFASLDIINEKGDLVTSVKSASEPILSGAKEELTIFWDTAGVKAGTYSSSLFLRYGQQSEQRDLKLDVSSNNINIVGVGYVISKGNAAGGGNGLVTILVVAVIILVLINAVWFLILRKKLFL